MIEILLLLSGLSSGFIGSILGVGGGIFLMPLLVMGLDLNVKEAVGISLFCVVGTSIAAMQKSLNNGFYCLRVSMFLEIFAILGAILSSCLSYRINSNLSMLLFGFFLLLLSFLITIFDINKSYKSLNCDQINISISFRIISLAFVSFLMGVLTGTFGIGGGVLMVPILVIIGNISISSAVKISLCLMLTSGSVALSVYFAKGSVSLNLAMISFLGVFPASLFGSKIREHLNEETIKIIFSIFIMLLGLTIIFFKLGSLI